MSTAHVTPVRTYVTTFVALIILTGLTYLAAIHDFGMMNTPIALAIAFVKASLVVMFFMGLRFNTPLTKVTAVAGFFWLIIMFGIILSDYATRGWMGVPGR
jgi:cytochrome c oxidase subunit 4